MPWLVHYNSEIDWKIEEVKITRCPEECRKQWKPKQKKSGWEKQEKEKEKKKQEKKKPKKEKTIEVQKVVEE